MLLVAVSIWFATQQDPPVSTSRETTREVGTLKVVDKEEQGGRDINQDVIVPLVLGLLTALAGGGALGAPVKFLWDELSNRAQNRRQVELSMRDRLHLYVEKYYLPIVYAARSLEQDAKEWATLLGNEGSATAEQRATTFDRFLYSVAQIWEVHRTMRHAGAGWFFRSATGEHAILATFQELRRLVDRSCEIEGNERSLLASALYRLEPRDFVTFQRRLRSDNGLNPSNEWDDVMRYRRRLLDACGNEEGKKAADFMELAVAAEHTANLLVYYSYEIYTPWYRDAPIDVMRPHLTAAQDWLRRIAKSPDNQPSPQGAANRG